MKMIKFIVAILLIATSYIQSQVVDGEILVKILNDQGNLEVWMAGLTGIKDEKTLLRDLDTFSNKSRSETPIRIKISKKCNFAKIARLIQNITNRKFIVYVYSYDGDCLFKATELPPISATPDGT